MHRTGHNAGVVRKTVVFVASGSAAGVLAGAALGLVGSSISVEASAGMITGLSVVGLGIGSVELMGRRVRLLENDRETPRAWLADTPLIWALKTGAALGVGATTRIGFPLWYAIPLGAALSGSVVVGAAIYGTYALVRSGTAIGLLLGLGARGENGALRLVRAAKVARRVSAGQLAMMSATACISIGL